MKKKFTLFAQAMLFMLLVLPGNDLYGQTVLIDEIFDIANGELDSDSTHYDAQLPEGWEVNDCYSSGKSNYNLTEGDPSNAILLKNNDSYLITPAVNKPGVLTFWVMVKELVEGGLLRVEKSIAGGEFTEVGSVSPTLDTAYVGFTIEVNDNSDNVRLKFTSATGSLEEFKFYLDYVVLMEYISTEIENLPAEVNFKIAGNYVNDILNFKTSSERGHITILDMSGRTVMKCDYYGNKTVNVSNLNSGMFLMLFSDQTGNYIEKFYKK